MTRCLLFLLAAALLCPAQQYSGPRPPKPDIPYLKHASNLIATEIAEAKEEKRGVAATLVIAGEASSARTPLAMPIFLMTADQVSPIRLQLIKLDSRAGHREGPQTPIHMEIARISSDNIYKLEVDQELEPGEYALIRPGSTQVFCFEVY